MRKFDTKVQFLKYKVLREVARQAWEGTLIDNLLEIPKMIVPGKAPTGVRMSDPRCERQGPDRPVWPGGK